MRIFRVASVIAVFGMLLAVPGAVIAAGAPTAKTDTATAIGSTSATLNGTVNPHQQATAVSFQYGRTTAYGTTAAAGTVTGNNAKSVSVSISGLTPNTLYHFRVTATNASGQSVGQDMTFTTAASGPPPPTKNAVRIATATGTVTYGHSTVISGKVTGPGSGGVQVALQAQSYPFTTPFAPTGAVTNTRSSGHYSFTVAPRIRTRYRVVAKTTPPTTSDTVTVGVRYAISFSVSDTVMHRGERVRFFGSVRPAANGRTVFIQRRSSTGAYHTVARAVLRATTSSTRSSYSRLLRIFTSGVYRVHVRGHTPYASSNSRTRRITVG